MKKLIALLLILALMLSFAACSADSDKDSDDGEKTSQNETDKDDDKDKEDNKDDDKANKEEITFTELTVVDNEQCSIKITEIDPDNTWGYTLKAQLENKSADKKYMFSVESASINGVKCDPYFASEVAAGKKSNSDISFSNTALDKNDIGAYTDIELTFRVYDSDDWSADDIVQTTVHVYPYGEEKATKFTREAKASDNVVVDNEYVTVIVTGYEQDDIWGYTANLFLVNKTDKTVMFDVEDDSVNGFMIDSYYAESLAAGKCAFSSMSWSNEDLEENDITKVEEIEFTLEVYDPEDWMAEDYVNQTVTLAP